MKNLIATVTLLFSASLFAGFTDLEKVEVNPEQSTVNYLGKKVTGEHRGEVKIQSGHLNFKGDDLFAGEFVIDMTSISNRDITDKDYLKKFIDHMMSADFFDTTKFKTATLKISKATKEKNNDYKIEADLTIKGITAPVTFPANITKEKSAAKIVFDRTKYGIKFKSGKYDPGLGDKLIYDDVQIDVVLVSKFVNTKAPTEGAVNSVNKNKKITNKKIK